MKAEPLGLRIVNGQKSSSSDHGLWQNPSFERLTSPAGLGFAESVGMTHLLVVYFSRTGFTRTIARQIARACSSNLESIEDATGRSHSFGYARSAFEAALHLDTPIRSAKHVPSDYDVVVIGTPVWCWNVASPVRAYIKKHRRQFKRVAFFCTFGGSGQTKVLRDLESLCGRPPVATLAVSDADITGELYHDRLSKFAAALKSSGRLRRRPRRAEKIFGKSSLGL